MYYATEAAVLLISSQNVFINQSPCLLRGPLGPRTNEKFLWLKRDILKLAFKSIIVKLKDSAAKIYSL